jgi:hypothetical protein
VNKKKAKDNKFTLEKPLMMLSTKTLPSRIAANLFQSRNECMINENKRIKSGCYHKRRQKQKWPFHRVLSTKKEF